MVVNGLNERDIMEKLPKLVLATRIVQPWNPLDVLLGIALGSRYIHSELIFPDMKLEHKSFSSRGRVKNVSISDRTKRKEKKGVYFASVDYQKGRWLYTDLLVSETEKKDVYGACLALAGCGYDTPGAVLNCGLHLTIDKKDKYWCSEAVTCVLSTVLGLRRDNLTPQQLLNKVQKYEYMKYMKGKL